MSFNGPLFLVGMPRSGTKLLRDLCNRHPRIAIPPAETEFLPYMANWIGRVGDLSDLETFREFHEHITKNSYFLYRDQYRPRLSAETWYGSCRDFSAAGVFEALVRIEVDAPFGSDVIWGDKSPSYIDDIELIAKLYPCAKFVHIIRDVRDYCLSINAAWKKNMVRASQRWVDDVERARAAGRRVGPSVYTEVRYEDLIDDPAQELERLCGFLGVPYDERMTVLENATENLGDTKGQIGVVRNNYGKYRDRMPQGLLTQVEAIAGETLIACGYSLTGPYQTRKRMPPWTMLMAQLQDGWQLLRRRPDGRDLLKHVQVTLRYFVINRATRLGAVLLRGARATRQHPRPGVD